MDAPSINAVIELAHNYFGRGNYGLTIVSEENNEGSDK